MSCVCFFTRGSLKYFCIIVRKRTISSFYIVNSCNYCIDKNTINDNKFIYIKFIYRNNFVSNIRTMQAWTSDKVVKSPYKDVVIPDMSVVDFMWKDLEKWSTKTAMVCGITNRQYTYEQLYFHSRTLGAKLRKSFKIQNGDAVAIMLPNIPEYPIVALGISAAGAVVTTLNPLYTTHELQRQFLISTPKAIFVVNETAAIVKETIKLAKIDIPVIAINLNNDLPEGTERYAELTEDNNVDLSVLKDVKVDTNDVAFLHYSSGTTGLPKGVELTHRNIIANCLQQSTDLRFYEHTTENHQDTTLAILPIFHSYGLNIVMLHKLSVGLRLVTLPCFQPETMVDVLDKNKFDLMYLAPPTVLFLGSCPKITSKHLERLRTVVCGAAPLPQADVERLLAKAVQPGVHFGQAYGLTETGPLATISPFGNKNYESVGLPLPNVELRIVDQNNKSLGPNRKTFKRYPAARVRCRGMCDLYCTKPSWYPGVSIMDEVHRVVGELLIKGPNVMKGYRNNPEANKEVFVDGSWLRTGDLARIGEDGSVYILDRLKELIKVSGFQVPPAELEDILKEHPAVFDVAVIGVKDPKSGERPKAFIVLNEGFKPYSEDIMNFVNTKVAPYKKIREVMFLKEIPRNPSGKILRRVLVEKFGKEQ